MKKNKPVLICFGTRPEWLKIKPLVNVLNKDSFKLFFTGQHSTLMSISDMSIYDNSIIKIKDIPSNSNRLDDVISSCISNFPDDEYSFVIVQGDTASAFSCAIAAFNRKIPVIHLEAGLRTNDIYQPYPEEAYRQMISRITSIHLSPTELSKQNLLEEKVSGKIYVVGNTVLDNIVNKKNEMTSYGNKILITLHRRENHEMIREWFESLQKLAINNPDIEFVFPIHPNPNVRIHADLLKSITVVEPMNHDDLIDTIKECKLIITDSGGIQEEATFFNKKVIVCRESTERPEGIYTGHLHLCRTPIELKKIFDNLINDVYIDEPCPYGDGFASEKIKRIIELNMS